MIDLQGIAVLVTGGSRGIGAACVRLLAQAGADVAFTFNRDTRAADRLVREVKGMGRQCIALRCAADRRRDVERVVRRTHHAFGHIDVLVNNAGIWKHGAIGAMTERQWDETLNVNLKGTFLMTNAVVPIMKKQRSGRIVNIASTAGQRGEAFHSHYAASKGGVIAFTKSIGPELAPHGIIANCVAPGWVDTDMSADVLRDPARRRKIKGIIPVGRPATPEEIAGSVLFLASPLSNHLVGSTISVNGGSVLSN
jgi:3-oxoacyl-[acyl-carrier protein] reductase